MFSTPTGNSRLAIRFKVRPCMGRGLLLALLDVVDRFGRSDPGLELTFEMIVLIIAPGRQPAEQFRASFALVPGKRRYRKLARSPFDCRSFYNVGRIFLTDPRRFF